MYLFCFVAASFNPFKLGSVTPKSTRRNGSTYNEHAQKRRMNYKRSADLSNGRRRRSEDCEDSRRDRKQKRVATRRSQRSKAAQEEKEEDATIKDKITRFYKQYNPAKLGEIDGLLEKYSGRETEMFSRLVKRYNADPALFGLDKVVKVSTSTNAADGAPRSINSNTLASGFAFGVSSTPAAFGSSETFKGFGSVTTETKWGSSNFTAPTSSFLSLDKATSTFASSRGTKHVSFGLGTTTFGGAFSSRNDKPKTFGSIAWDTGIRANSSFDSEMDMN